MNKNKFHICFALLLFIGSSDFLNGQSRIPQFDEKVSLFSDRNLYVAGEKIFFSAFIHNKDRIDNSEVSHVLYCEIVTSDGSKISAGKYMIENSFAYGNLLIPSDITTGTYYLRAYTKFMRNEGPGGYYYSRIKIVNANRTEVQAVAADDVMSEEFLAANDLKIGDSLFIISSDKLRYASRDTVIISFKSKGTIHNQWKGLSVSVVPEFSIFNGNINLTENIQSEKSIIYFPETKGISITGKLSDNKTGNAMPDTRVNLSIIGKGRDFMAMKTDTEGRFYFALPDYSGTRDLFLCAENTGNSEPKLLVDNDFCKIPIHIPTSTFALSPNERTAAYNMAINLQLEEYFRVDTIKDEDGYATEEHAFYGKPNEVLYIDNYVQLPTLEEYFNGLPTLVKVRKRQGEKYFKILGPQTDLTEFDPLVMVDLVAIVDPTKILAIPPSNISRIEIVNGLYVKGDQTYGGIINIISKRGDFAGIDLPSSGIFINYGFYSEEKQSQQAKQLRKHSPDTRNTIFWEPHLMLNQDNTSKVSFMTSDTPGRYKIILSGIDEKGQIYSQTESFEVVK
jgi:hypothetical protein